MKQTTKEYIKSNLFTGFIAVLPLTLLFLVLSWLYGLLGNIINPIANIFSTPSLIVNAIVMAALIVLIFIIGLAIRTAPGRWFEHRSEKYVFSKIPGYKMIKDMLKPLTEKNYKKSFKSVVLVNLYENSLLVTAFVTDKSPTKGYTTVFIPTGPNPTSGQIVHVKNKYVHPVDISIDKVLKSVIAVGSGSKDIIENMKK